jgi:FixJ family two-component response regulator
MASISALPLIAVVDDEETVRTALGRLIRSAGFTVATFASGGDFLRSVRDQCPQCLVMDLHMPQLNGFDVQVALQHARLRIPLVVITGDDTQASRSMALAYGAAAYLRKPVDDAMLMDAIRSALRSGELPTT